jgi:hypothetical protein
MKRKLIVIGVAALVGVQGFAIWRLNSRLTAAERGLMQIYVSVSDYNFIAAKAGLPQFGQAPDGSHPVQTHYASPRQYLEERRKLLEAE